MEEVDEKLSRHVWSVRDVELGAGEEIVLDGFRDCDPVRDWDGEELADWVGLMD